MIGKLGSKLSQSIGFLQKSRTPIPLMLDSFKLKRRPFDAVDRSGIRLRLNPRCGDSFTFFEILIRGDYLKDGIAVGPGDTVFDVGSNFGAFAIVASRAVGPSGRVLAFEPSPEAFQRLSENLERNHCENVEAHPFAIGGQSGTAELFEHEKSAYNSLFSDLDGKKLVPKSVHNVPVKTLEQVLDERGLDRVDLLKLDCEGAEYGILETLTPAVAGRIKQIAMEAHRIPGHDVEELFSRLDQLGFDVRPTYPSVAFNRRFEPVAVPS